MKKLFLLMTMVAMCFIVGAQTQVPVLSEDFANGIPSTWTNIDADGDGYTWLSSTTSGVSGHNGVGCAYSQSYDGSVGPLTPNNWLVTPAISLTGASTLNFWVCAQDVNYPNEHWGVFISTTSATDSTAFTLLYEETFTPSGAKDQSDWQEHTITLDSYAGQTVYIAFRHFNCTNMFYLNLDDVTVTTTLTGATIVSSPSGLNFGTVLLGNTSQAQTVNVIAFNNTNPISATVTAPFTVSADNTTFGTTASLPDTGGVLYVKFTPTVAGADTALMTLTAGTASTTVDLLGYGLDCSPVTIPLVEDFEATSITLSCWSMSNVDANTGVASNASYSYSGSNFFAFAYNDNPPQYLISPELTGTGSGVKVELMYRVYSASYPESFALGYSTTTNDPSAFTWGIEQTNLTNTTYQLYEEIIPAANVKFVAIKYTADDMYFLFIDSVVIKEAPSCIPPAALAADNITTGSATLSWTGDANSYTIIDMANGTVLATQSGTSYSLTGLTAMTQYTYGVVANCTSANSDTVTVTFSTACTAVSLPYTETFAATSATRNCWNLVSMNTGNDLGTNYGMGFYTVSDREVLRFSSYSNHGGSNDYNQYGFSPLMEVSSNASYLKADVTYATYSSSNKLYFGYVTANDTVWDPTEYTTTGSTDWQTISLVIPATATQLAVNYYGNYSFYAWIDTVVVTEMTGDYCFPVSNLTATDVTAHEATLTWSGDANTYTIVNMANGSVVATQADTSYSFTNLTPVTQYTFGVVANCTTGTSDTVTVSFTTLISCPVPTGLAVSLTPGNGTIATLTWTETGSATAWQICVNDDTTNLINVTATTYNFTGLTAEQAYSVKVRAICDVNDMSAWSSPLTFTPTNAYTITLNDGTTTNSYVPIYGLYVDEITKSQFIIPAADLAAMQYGTINKLTFYASQANINWGAATFNVYLTETTDATVTSLADYSSMTQVYAGTLSIVNNIMEVNFTTPYLYMGGNLMVGFLQTVEGTYASSYWYGVSATGASMGGYNTTVSQRNFLPKTKIDYTPGTAPSCLPVTDLTVSNVTDSQVTLTWNGNAASYSVYDGSNFVASTTATTYTFTGLTASTDYVFGVRAVCSATDSSIISNVTASTPCPDVTTLPYNEGFENGLGCWTTINASSDGQPWSVNNCSGLSTVNPHNGAYVASSWSWSGSSMHANAWLISPKFVLPNATDSLSFSWWEITNGLYPDHYSVVLSTTTCDTAAFTTVLRPYDTAASTWTLQTVDLTPYAGQSVYIAFHHVDYDANYLLIDDIALYQGAYIPPAPDSLTVVFAVNDATMGTTVPAPGTYQYLMGDTVAFHPEANTGYHFTNWVMSAGGQTDTLAANYVSVYFIVNGAMMSYGTVTMTALFEADSTPVTDALTIHLSINNPALGTIEPLPGTYHVALNDSLVLSATPNAGVNFDGWKIMIGGQTLATVPINPFTLPVNQNNITFGEVTIVAMFNDGSSAPDSITVIVNTADATMGTTNPAPGTYHYAVGSESFLAALPNPGYHNLYWIEEFAIAGMVEYDTLYADTVILDVVPMMAGVTLSITAYFEANAGEPCDVPTNVAILETGDESLSIGWDANADVAGWNVRYRQQGTTEWSYATTSTNSITLTNLTFMVWYEIQVQADCGDGNTSDWSATVLGYTLIPAVSEYLDSQVSLYPNPAREYVDIRVEGDLNVKMMEVYDVYGKLINTVMVTENPTRINVSSLANGMYFVRVSTEVGVVTKTFIKK